MLGFVPSRPRVNYSPAARRYLDNLEDIGELLAFHSVIGGSRPGRRKLDVLNKSGVVLLCAFWEAFCEDLADEALGYLVRRASGPDALPEPLKKIISTELKAAKHELAPWKLAGEGWRKLMTERAAELRAERNRSLNTPKADEIRGLFARTLGITDVTTGWHWKRMTVAQAKSRLDQLVTLRGDIAHRGASSVKPVWKKDLKVYVGHITHLVAATEVTVTMFLQAHQAPRLPAPALQADVESQARLDAIKRALERADQSAH
jgi:hypothetical protein